MDYSEDKILGADKQVWNCDKEYARQGPVIVRPHLQKAITTEVYICMSQVTTEG